MLLKLDEAVTELIDRAERRRTRGASMIFRRLAGDVDWWMEGREFIGGSMGREEGTGKSRRKVSKHVLWIRRMEGCMHERHQIISSSNRCTQTDRRTLSTIKRKGRTFVQFTRAGCHNLSKSNRSTRCQAKSTSADDHDTVCTSIRCHRQQFE